MNKNCVNCNVCLTSKVTRSKQIATLDIVKLKIAERLFKKSFSLGDKICNSCRLKVSKNQENVSEFPPDSDSDTEYKGMEFLIFDFNIS